jgi:hypothetical protein
MRRNEARLSIAERFLVAGKGEQPLPARDSFGSFGRSPAKELALSNRLGSHLLIDGVYDCSLAIAATLIILRVSPSALDVA